MAVNAIMLAVFAANYKVYGARKLTKAMRRAGHQNGRDQVGRLMREAGTGGVRRGRRVFTTRSDPGAARPADLVKRVFTADRPNALWVLDFERHEAFLNPAVMKGHRRWLVAAS